MVWFGTTFALGEPAVRINWTATYWCPLNCSCTKFPSAHVSFSRAFEYFDLFLIAFNSVFVLLLSVLLLLLSSVLSYQYPT